MATLTNNTIASTYTMLLKMKDTGVDADLNKVESGDADDCALSLATAKIGIDTTDTLHFDGDNGDFSASDTYIYESATDQLDFVVGGDTDGFVLLEGGGVTKVGIGTASPTYQLQIKSSTAGAINIFSVIADDDGHVMLVGKDGEDDGYVNIYDGAGNQTIHLDAKQDSFINTDGNVGIGTVSPETELEIASTSSAPEIWIHREASDLTDGNTVGTLSFSANTTRVAKIVGVVEGTSENAGDLAFYTATGGSLSEHMRILSDGNVGIGITSPTSRLHVSVPSDWNTTNPAMHIVNNDTSGNHGNGLLIQAGASAHADEYILHCTDLGTTTRFQVHRSSGVGIGTATYDGSVVGYLAIANGTEPSAHTDNQVYIGAKDASTSSESTLAIFCEEDPVAHDSGGSYTNSHKMKIWINGTEYWIVLDAV